MFSSFSVALTNCKGLCKIVCDFWSKHKANFATTDCITNKPTNQPTKCKEQSPCWKSNSSLPTQEIPLIVEAGGSLPHSQQPATCPYPEPDQTSPRPFILFLEDQFWCYLAIYIYVIYIYVYIPTRYTILQHWLFIDAQVSALHVSDRNGPSAGASF